MLYWSKGSRAFFFFFLSLFLFRTTFTSRRIPHAHTSIVTHAFQGFRGCTWVERVPTFSARKRSLPKGTHARDDPAVWSLPRASFLSRISSMGWWLLNGICVYTIFTRLFNFESQESIDLPSCSVYIRYFTRNHRFWALKAEIVGLIRYEIELFEASSLTSSSSSTLNN